MSRSFPPSYFGVSVTLVEIVFGSRTFVANLCTSESHCECFWIVKVVGEVNDCCLGIFFTASQSFCFPWSFCSKAVSTPMVPFFQDISDFIVCDCLLHDTSVKT